MEAPGPTVVAVCDLRTERLAQLRVRYPTIHTVNDAGVLFNDPSLDAIVIATTGIIAFRAGYGRTSREQACASRKTISRKTQNRAYS